MKMYLLINELSVHFVYGWLIIIFVFLFQKKKIIEKNLDYLVRKHIQIKRLKLFAFLYYVHKYLLSLREHTTAHIIDYPQKYNYVFRESQWKFILRCTFIKVAKICHFISYLHHEYNCQDKNIFPKLVYYTRCFEFVKFDEFYQFFFVNANWINDAFCPQLSTQFLLF